MTYQIKNLVENSIEYFNDPDINFSEWLTLDYTEKQIKEIKYDYKRQLDINFREFMDDEIKKSNAIQKLKKESFIKLKQQNIANDFFIRKSDIEKFFINFFFNELKMKKGILLETKILETLQDNYYFDDKRKFSFLKKDLSKIISLFSPFILSGGNNQNYSLLEIGVNNSNQGDGAEHIFVAKAMIAGFNASKVDVGSSDYDAIIEGKSGNLLKVQIKSFTNDVFSRKGRDRGGEGIDSSNRSNIGKLVTSKNCDILVAVNKKNSELFIFSKNEIDKLPEKTINRKDYMENWENWSKINQ